MPKAIDMTGERFGRLVALKWRPTPSGRPKWQCLCDCGSKTLVRRDHLISGKQVSCGCHNAENRGKSRRTHGDSQPVDGYSQAPEYTVWNGMKKRCSDPKNRSWQRYGGRGIRVCDRWICGDGSRSGYQCFLVDMGRRPSRRHQLDRVNNDGNYEPSNCRWATSKQQNRNRTKNKIVEYSGRVMCLAEACEISGAKYRLVQDRLARGWSVDEAINRPHAWMRSA